VFRLQSWKTALRTPILRSLRRRVTWLRRPRSGDPAANGAAESEPQRPKITDPEVGAFLEAAYQKVIDRRLPLLVVLTGESWYYPGSFVDAFPRLQFGEEVMVELMKEADHVFTPRGSSERVTHLIVGFARRHWERGISRGA
jgi:hypothetical protein